MRYSGSFKSKLEESNKSYRKELIFFMDYDVFSVLKKD